mmetsp:Transcript_26161/g.44990  ORF Transcript_26161/g.44990 Transcript_26161/m.44990 type:complete len:112 (+) Transcript_26161:99-434(+)
MAFVLATSFFGSKVQVARQAETSAISFCVRNEEAAAPTPSPVQITGQNPFWQGRVIRLDYTFPGLNSTKPPQKAMYSKLVPFAQYNTEYQRIVKNGGKIVSGAVVGGQSSL